VNTAEDIRIIFAEKVSLRVLERALQMAPAQGKKELLEKVKELQQIIVRIKYSNLDGISIRDSDMARELKQVCREIAKGLGSSWETKVDAIISANLKFALNNIYNLPERMCLPDNPAFACDIRQGKVISVDRGNKVLICKVDVGTRKITVVTNDMTVKEGNNVAVIFLPPAEIYGTVSEGMFLGAGEGVLKDLEGKPGDLPQVPDAALEESRRKILSYLRKG